MLIFFRCRSFFRVPGVASPCCCLVGKMRPEKEEGNFNKGRPWILQTTAGQTKKWSPLLSGCKNQNPAQDQQNQRFLSIICRLKLHKQRLQKESNNLSHFILLLLLRLGQSLNPGPVCPCGVCSQNVTWRATSYLCA